MRGFIYSVLLQFKLDIRNKSLLVTCYLVPLLFFLVVSEIFTSIMPETKATLIASMTIMQVSMGALIGVPANIIEVYGTDVKKMYQINGVPLYFGIVTLLISSFLHLLIMSLIILGLAPLIYQASLPNNLLVYLITLIIFIAVSLIVGSVLGLLVKSQTKLSMYAQLVFLPSILLSGIMFDKELLPAFLRYVGNLFPATWSFELFNHFDLWKLLPLAAIFIIGLVISLILLKRSSLE
ncbi:ABC transporter permease [uncultured Thomasclavelia sp.]|uniref:ABC transporter permease n=1 Tax=uncultured Thomasclavelia sp. TaxID=3025759 RepID=UPI0025F57FBE|nr:ABC transporter permease [uncultured Thomasclavelia sp.]